MNLFMVAQAARTLESQVRGEPLARTRTSTYVLRDDGIIVQTIVVGGCQTLEDARENTRAFNRIAGERKRLLLVDMKAAYSTAPGVRDYYASEEAARCVTALAMMAASSTARIVGNFFLSLSNPGYPCRLFSKREAAIAWLQTQA